MRDQSGVDKLAAVQTTKTFKFSDPVSLIDSKNFGLVEISVAVLSINSRCAHL